MSRPSSSSLSTTRKTLQAARPMSQKANPVDSVALGGETREEGERTRVRK